MAESLFEALLDAQREIKHAVKDSKNPHLKNTYASLSSVIDAVIPVMNKHGIVVLQTVMPGKEKDMIIVKTGFVFPKTKESVTDELPIPIPHKWKDGVDLGIDAQGLGSSITYARRYGLQTMGGIASEDDDGNEASVAIPKTETGGGHEPAAPDEIKAIQERVTKSLGTLGFKPKA